VQKSGIIVVASGVLIVLGLVLLVIGNQIILEGVSQGNGKVRSSQEIVISTDFNSQDTSIGVFAVQIMDFKDNTFTISAIPAFALKRSLKNISSPYFALLNSNTGTLAPDGLRKYPACLSFPQSTVTISV